MEYRSDGNVCGDGDGDGGWKRRWNENGDGDGDGDGDGLKLISPCVYSHRQRYSMIESSRDNFIDFSVVDDAMQSEALLSI